MDRSQIDFRLIYHKSMVVCKSGNIGMDTKVGPLPDFFGHEDRRFLTFGRLLLSNSYVVQGNREYRGHLTWFLGEAFNKERTICGEDDESCTTSLGRFGSRLERMIKITSSPSS